MLTICIQMPKGTPKNNFPNLGQTQLSQKWEFLSLNTGRSRRRPLGPSGLGPLRPHSLSGRSVAPLRSVPRPPTTSPTRDRSPPAPSRTRTVLTDRSVARADLAFAPNGPFSPKPPLRPDGSTSANSFLSHDRHAPRAPQASPSPPNRPVIIHPLVGSRFTMPQAYPSY